MTSCTRHPAVVEGLAACDRCRRPFCADCLTALRDHPLCIDCKDQEVRDILSGVDPRTLEFANIGRRFAALMVDNIVIQIPTMLVFLTLFTLAAAAFQNAPYMMMPFFGILILGPMVVNVLYEGLLMRRNGQTLGKMVLGIRAVSPDGSPITSGQAWGRTVLRAVFQFLYFLEYLPAFFMKERTTLHDLAAKTRVINNPYTGVGCPKCGKTIAPALLSTGEIRCPHCSIEFRAAVFNPPTVELRAISLAESGPEGGVPCTNHGNNAAVIHCDRCGSFICELCSVAPGNQTFCTNCFERMLRGGELDVSRMTYQDHGGMAAVCGMLGMLFFFMFFFSPLAIYYGIKAIREKRRGLAYTSIPKAIAGIVLGIAGIGASLAFWISVIAGVLQQ